MSDLGCIELLSALLQVIFTAVPLFFSINILSSVVVGATDSCPLTHYRVMEKCCEMCKPGYYVFIDCTANTGTVCEECPETTYTDTHHGNDSCKICSGCNSTTFLRVKRACTNTSDTICEPLEGHYCTDPIKDGCQRAVEHTKCKPGQYIKEPGKISSDTECEDCDYGTYSNGTLAFCTPHTRFRNRAFTTVIIIPIALVALCVYRYIRRNSSTRHHTGTEMSDFQQPADNGTSENNNMVISGM